MKNTLLKIKTKKNKKYRVNVLKLRFHEISLLKNRNVTLRKSSCKFFIIIVKCMSTVVEFLMPVYKLYLNSRVDLIVFEYR